jgi:peptidoglycan/LPS O-acetylase OafA/YrhL
MNETSGTSGGRPILGQLTSLRFFAATAIVFHHFGHLTIPGNPILDRLLHGMGSGVSFFFVLSGFVLVYAYDSPIGVRSIRAFFIARFARVYPVYLLGLIGAVFLATLYLRYPGHLSASRILVVPGVLSLFLLQAWVPPVANLMNNPAWSLSAEAFFYLVFPFLLVPRVKGYLDSHRLAILVPLLLAGSAPLWLLHLTYPNADLAAIGTREFAIRNWTYFWPIFRIPEFILGVVLGFEFLRPDRREIPSWCAPVALAGVGFLMCMTSDNFQVLLHNSLLAPLFSIVIYGVATSTGRGSRILSNRWAVLLGESSYALYILHVPVESMTSILWHRAGFGPVGAAFFWCYLACSILASVVVFLYVETPLRKRIRRMLSKSKTPAPAEVLWHPRS